MQHIHARLGLEPTISTSEKLKTFRAEAQLSSSTNFKTAFDKLTLDSAVLKKDPKHVFIVYEMESLLC
jgi:hypothetical protein